MDWNDWLRVLRWRALEEADASGTLISEDRRHEATARTRGGLTSDDVRTESLTSREAAFLAKRSDWLEREIIGWSGPLVAVMEKLTVPRGRWTWALVGWGIALISGYSLTGLGQDSEFNLLALPLVGVLLWNAVVMALALVMELLPVRTSPKRGGLAEWLANKAVPINRALASSSTETGELPAEKRFALLAGPLGWERLQRRMRAWLHVAAALLAFGSAIALYARGWSKEYRAVWESTLLTEQQTSQFFASLFGPASRVIGVPVPLAQIPRMHRTAGKTASPAPALPWIHLYGGTLLLLVVMPRLGLAALTLLRSRAGLDRRARSLNWKSYLKHTLRAVEGGQETITVLIHAPDSAAASREVWLRGVKQRFGNLAHAEMVHVSPGDEDEFMSSWRPLTSKVVIVFNLATTPEAEVHRRLTSDARQLLLAQQRDAELVVLLDATSIGMRWTREKQVARERLWTDMLQGVADEVLIAACKGPSPALPVTSA